MSYFIQSLDKARKAGCYVSCLLVLLSMTGLALHGLNLGLDFSGGYVTEFMTEYPVSLSDMQTAIQSVVTSDIRVNSAQNGVRWTVRQLDIPDIVNHTEWLDYISHQLNVSITPLDSVYIGSQVGEELRDQSGLALLVAGIAIMVYLSMRFEWRLATGALLALAHDVVIVLGLFSWLQLPFDLTVLAAILAIIGYSLNDSIVVGDRVRELLRLHPVVSVEKSIDSAIVSTLARTLITSGTTLVTIACIGWLAGKPLEGFSVALFVGVLVGSLSSITISASLPQLLGLKADHYLDEPIDERLV